MSADVQFYEIPVVILAGGQSERMGKDKARIELGGTRLIDRVIERVRQSNDKIFLSGPSDYETTLPLIQDLPQGSKGPAAALFAATRFFDNKHHPGFFTLPVDVPDFPSDLFFRLFNLEQSQVARDSLRIHPTLGWWRLSDLTAFFENLEHGQSVSMHAVTRAADAEPVAWSEPDRFWNLNTPDDLAQYRMRLK